jgi:hypothetical protein
MFLYQMYAYERFNGILKLCESLTFIGYLCEICSMCENMAICVKI